MTARRVNSALVVVAIVLCFAVLASAQNSHARIVRLSYIDGDARIDQSSGEQRAIENMPVVTGTHLTAEDGSKLEVEFENGSTLRLVGPAEVNFRDLSLRGSGDKVTIVDIVNGLAYFDIIQKGDDEFRVSVHDHNLSVRKTSHFRVDASAESPKISIFKGELEMLDGPNVAVKKGETITFDSADPAHYALAKDVDPLGADVWDHDRAQDRDTYAKSQAYKNSLTYAGSPYSYGMYDLASYGSWFAAPGGPCWRPLGFGFGWDPFSQGAWTYYPNNGWVFVSGYPWGWTPYRYGSWNWFGGTGWCWSPGYYNGWNAIPVVITHPPTFLPPKPPTKPPGPPVFIGGRKAIDGKTDPDAFRHPAKGFGDDGPPRRGRGLPAVVGVPGVPSAGTGNPAPVPAGKRWGGEPAPAPGKTPMPTKPPANPPPASPAPKGDTPRPAPTPAPRMDPGPRSPAPSPHIDSSPRMTPAPSPAPAPRVDSPKTTPHGMGFMSSGRASSMSASMRSTGHVSRMR